MHNISTHIERGAGAAAGRRGAECIIYLLIYREVQVLLQGDEELSALLRLPREEILVRP